MGKGDTRRPMRISQEEYDANWEAAFGTGGDQTNSREDLKVSEEPTRQPDPQTQESTEEKK